MIPSLTNSRKYNLSQTRIYYEQNFRTKIQRPDWLLSQIDYNLGPFFCGSFDYIFLSSDLTPDYFAWWQQNGWGSTRLHVYRSPALSKWKLLCPTRTLFFILTGSSSARHYSNKDWDHAGCSILNQDGSHSWNEGGFSFTWHVLSSLTNGCGTVRLAQTCIVKFFIDHFKRSGVGNDVCSAVERGRSAKVAVIRTYVVFK